MSRKKFLGNDQRELSDGNCPGREVWEMAGYYLGKFFGAMSAGNCLGNVQVKCSECHAGLEVSMCGSYDLWHPS